MLKSEQSKEDLLEEIKELKNNVDYWEKQYNDMEEMKDELENRLSEYEEHEGIKDLEEFKWQAKLDGVWNDKLEEFLDHYLKYHNA